MWFATAAYRITQVQQAWAKFRYRRLGGRCYACPGRYGSHKFTCPVGVREISLTREDGGTRK
jgi:hypothetical protein